jgi:hypothetical protein
MRHIRRHAWGIVLALTLELLNSATVQAQTTVKDTKPPFPSHREFLESSRESLRNEFGLHALDPTQPVEQEVGSIMDKLDDVAGFFSEISATDQGWTGSHPAAGVFVSVPQLDRIRQQSNVQFFPVILRLILAHEKAHQIQYREYGAALTQRPVAERRVYEAQADLLAGKDLTESIDAGKPVPNNDGIEDALRVMFDLGSEQYSLADHPSRESRRTAVRYGMAAGMITKFERMGGGPALQSAQILRQKIDMRTGEDALGWSLRLGRRLANFRRPAITDLVLTKEDIKYNINGDPPIVSYSLTYRNNGTHPINVDLEVKCVSVARADPDDSMLWQLIAAKNYRFLLQPGQRKTLQDAQTWQATKDLYPRLVLPPGPTSQVSVEYADGTTNLTTFDTAEGVPAFNLDAMKPIPQLGSILHSLLRAAGGRFLALRASPGRELSGGTITYASQTSIPGAVRNDIDYPQDSTESPEVRVLLQRTPSTLDAQGTYQSVVSQVSQALPDFTADERSSAGGGMTTTFSADGIPAVVTVRLGKTAKYSVSLAVEAVN